jgi:F-type H+-transporting ATPase subunit epsilon
MFLEITTPDILLFSGEVTSVQLPGIDGLFQILKHHAPLISILKKGKIKIETPSETLYFEINGGVIEVFKDTITILAE